MKFIRRSVVVTVVAALALSTGAVLAPAPSASEGRIWVSLLRDGTVELQADSTLSAFRLAEELFISTPGRSLVRIEMRDDDSPSGLGRAILTDGNTLASAYCTFADFRGSAVVTCDYLGVPQIRVDFRDVSVATTVVMAEGTTVPLAFRGGPGPDEVYGAAGDDYLLGGAGDDRLFGGPGNDYLDGGHGDDYLEGEQGRDDMRGGPGRDSLDAADNTADIRVDCGGLPAFLDYDKGLDTPENCGPNPTPIPPGPVEPIDPPAPGQGEGTINGAPATVEVTADPEREDQVNVAVANGPAGTLGLMLVEDPVTGTFMYFPPLFLQFPFLMNSFWPNSSVFTSIWSLGGPPTVSTVARAMRTKPVVDEVILVNAQGVAEGNVPVPRGQQPGNFVLQINGVTAAGEEMSLNVGVALTQATPKPDPEPATSIAVTSATRGKGKKASTITVRGTSEGLAGKSITPRYRIKSAKKWILGKPVTVSVTGGFVWRHKARQEISIMMTSGAIRSKAVKVAAVRR